MLRITSVWACALLLAACATEASPPALPSASLVAFTEIAERCVQRPAGNADSVAAECVCQTLKGRGSVPVRCFATPYLLGFVGDSVPLPPIRRSRQAYYGLAFAPRGLDLAVTEQREVFKYGYGVATAQAGLPPHWYLLTYCMGCD